MEHLLSRLHRLYESTIEKLEVDREGAPIQINGREYQWPIRYRMAFKLRQRRGPTGNAYALVIRVVNSMELYRGCNAKFFRAWTTCPDVKLKNFSLGEGGIEFIPTKPWLKAMKILPEFSAETWREWADLAWKIIIAVSPEGKPGANPFFLRPATAICNVRMKRKDPYFETITSSPGIADADIKEAFSNAVEMVATGSSARTRQRHKPSPTKK